MARFKVSPKLDEYNPKIYELGADAVDYLEKAVKKGAVAVLTNRDLGINEQIIVDDTRCALSIIASNFYGNPSKKLSTPFLPNSVT